MRVGNIQVEVLPSPSWAPTCLSCPIPIDRVDRDDKGGVAPMPEIA